MTRHPKHIGIVACSAEGASLCYRTICQEGADQMGRHMHPEISMHTFPLGTYMDRIYRDDWEGVAALMLQSAVILQRTGAEFLICPDNTIHRAFEAVQQHSPLPWLHIAEEVAKEAVNRNFRRTGILGTKYLMTGPVYPEQFEKYEIQYVIPEEQDREKVDGLIFNELVYGELRPETSRYLLGLVRGFKAAGCDSVVLGCTEIPLAVLPGDAALPLLDSTRILAHAALMEALSQA
jgi:aspartate racemase